MSWGVTPFAYTLWRQRGGDSVVAGRSRECSAENRIFLQP
jgi:hypothetical protein